MSANKQLLRRISMLHKLGGGIIITQNEEKSKILSTFFASVFNRTTDFPQVSNPVSWNTGSRMKPPQNKKETFQDLLHLLDTQKSRGPSEIHPRVLRQLMEVVTGPLSIIYQQSRLTEEVPADSTSPNMIPTCKTVSQEDLGNYKALSPTSVPGKIIEQIILSTIT